MNEEFEEQEKGGILEPEEYEAIMTSMVESGVDDPDQIQAVIKTFERAAVTMATLGLVTKGVINIVAVGPDGDPVVKADENISFKPFDEAFGDDDKDWEDDGNNGDTFGFSRN